MKTANIKYLWDWLGTKKALPAWKRLCYRCRTEAIESCLKTSVAYETAAVSLLCAAGAGFLFFRALRFGFGSGSSFFALFAGLAIISAGDTGEQSQASGWFFMGEGSEKVMGIGCD